MSSKRNQTIAIARFLMYKYGLNQQLEGMTDEEYLAHPIGLDVGQYVPDLTDKGYVAQMQARMQDRLNYVEGLKDAEGGFNALPDDAADAIRKVVEQANSL